MILGIVLPIILLETSQKFLVVLQFYCKYKYIDGFGVFSKFL